MFHVGKGESGKGESGKVGERGGRMRWENGNGKMDGNGESKTLGSGNM